LNPEWLRESLYLVQALGHSAGSTLLRRATRVEDDQGVGLRFLAQGQNGGGLRDAGDANPASSSP